MWTKEEINEMVEKGECLSEELKELFAKHPEKKEAYKQKVYDSQGGGGGKVITNTYCNTCMFCEIINPIGRQPQTRYCEMFDKDETDGKPDDILFNGAECPFYEKES